MLSILYENVIEVEGMDSYLELKLIFMNMV